MWKVFADLHTHTKVSRAKGSIRENAEAAQQAGLEILGIADHGPANWGHGKMSSLKDFEMMMAETKRVEQEFSGLKIFAGVEADIISYQGELDVPLELQRKLDQVLAGFHLTVRPRNFEDGFEFATEWFLAKLGPRQHEKARIRNTKSIVEAIYRNEIDIITHPGLKISIDTTELARACAKNETALEINAKHGVKSTDFIKTAARQGVKFAIGSDAHKPEAVGKLEAGVHSAQAAGLSAEQIINVREV